MKSVLFVCLGNICRSPIAHGIAQDLVKQNNLDVKIDSCGTSSYHEGEAPHKDSVNICLKNGIDIRSQKSRPIVSEDFTSFDYILCMDDENLTNLHNMGCKKAKKLGDYGFSGQIVMDPYVYSGKEEVFAKVYKMIKEAVENFFKKEKLL